MVHVVASPRRLLVKWGAWFTLINFGLLCLIGLRFTQLMPTVEGGVGQFFLYTTFASHFALLAFLAFGLLIVPLILLIPRPRLIVPGAVLIASALLIVLIADTMVFELYRFHLNSFVLNLFLNDKDNDIFQFSMTMKLYATLAGATVLLLESGAAWLTWRYREWLGQLRIWRSLSALFFGALLASHLTHAWAAANYQGTVTQQTRYFPLFFPTTAQGFMERHDLIDPANLERKRQNVSLNASSDLDYPKVPLTCNDQQKPLNLVLIVLDSWRHDTMNEQATPNIHRLSQESVVFNNHFSGGNSTRTGIFSLFYGIPGAYWHSILANQRGPVLFDELLRNNYDLGIFASASLTNIEFDKTVFSKVKNLRARSETGTPHERDQEITQLWLDWLAQRTSDKPFFGFLFYDAIHGYSKPDDYPKVFEPEWNEVNYLALSKDFDPKPFFNRYRNTAHFVDSLVGKVLADLRARNLLENTVVMITSDHGEEFNDNGLNYWGHNGNFTDAQVKVPMVVHWPGKSHEVSNQLTSHFDVAPTLVGELLSCSTASQEYSVGNNWFLDGENGQPAAEDWLILSNYSAFAIMEHDRVTVSDIAGGYEVLDRHGRALPDAPQRPAVALGAINKLNRFFK